MNDGRPTTLYALQYENDVAVLGLINRLKAHHITLSLLSQRNTALEDVASDVLLAKTVLEFLLRNRDDYK